MERIESVTELERVLERSGRSLIYKHSPRCWICLRAMGQVREFEESGDAVPVYLVDVIDDREVSARAAELLDVPHQSPQAILVEDGAAIWDASHFSVSAKKLRDRAAS